MMDNEMQTNPGFREWVFNHEKHGTGYEDYRRRWRDNPVQGVWGKYPLHIDLEVTNRCNLKCPFCIREHDPSMEVGNMKYEMAVKILDECAMKVPGIKFNWRGEPTMYKKLPFLVQRAKLNGFMDIGINTNGTILTPNMFGSLEVMGIDRIIYSIDSHISKSYLEQRVGANYETTMRNLRGAINLKKMKRWDRPYIRVQKVDIPELRHENEDYVRFFKDLGVDSVAINTYKNKDETKLGRWKSLSCAMPFQRLMIAWDGNAYPCCQGQLFAPLGNVNEMSIKELWSGPTMKRLRKMHSTGQQDKIPQCANCETTIVPDYDEKEMD